MPSRKKRLKRGIESTKKQIELHKDKQELAKQRGEGELEGYYAKEIEALKNVVKRKEEKLKK